MITAEELEMFIDDLIEPIYVPKKDCEEDDTK